ncbi:tyrosine-type recombinase/integrase (plasmid) [Coraliomargarita sp. W4R53]
MLGTPDHGPDAGVYRPALGRGDGPAGAQRQPAAPTLRHRRKRRDDRLRDPRWHPQDARKALSPLPRPPRADDRTGLRGQGSRRAALRRRRQPHAQLRKSGWFANAVKRAQAVDPSIPRLTPHDLRHTAASLAISSGANVKAVQRMLGHASAAMTLDTYADLFDDDLDAVATRLNEAMPLVALPAGPQTRYARPS